MNADKKRLNGQFFTIVNPFDTHVFFQWFGLIPDDEKLNIIEPFAGSNNIVKMIADLSLSSKDTNWHCYDIEIQEQNNSPQNIIIQQDTIEHFPDVANIAITNPPYLAKNSATRRGMEYKYPEYDDLYKKALSVMLNHCGYVAAIIPESFITADLFHNRLYAFKSLNCRMFDDTECPVCLAMFVPSETKRKIRLNENDFYIALQGAETRKYSEYDKNEFLMQSAIHWTMNDKTGNIGIRCIDGTTTASIEFVKGDDIKADKIKSTSRSLTRVSGLPSIINEEQFLKKCNELLSRFRKETGDIFLTSFKGLRKDGQYRRRLDFSTAQQIMNRAVYELGGC